MNTPQDRVIKKMIDNIVETNRPAFEKPVTGMATVTSAAATTAPSMVPEDYALITRKLDYGFNNLRQENTELRKQLDELGGGLKLIRGDLENIRSMLNQRGSASSHSPQASPRHEETHHAPPQAHAPNYKQSEADAAYERESGGSNQSHDEQPQARGIQKKDDSQIDISKVFYYGKK